MPIIFVKKIYKRLNSRICADFVNEWIVDLEIVSLAQADELKNFMEDTIFKEGGYIYMPFDKILPGYVFSEWYVIPNSYKFRPYKWYCKLSSKLEYI